MLREIGVKGLRYQIKPSVSIDDFAVLEIISQGQARLITVFE